MVLLKIKKTFWTFSAGFSNFNRRLFQQISYKVWSKKFESKFLFKRSFKWRKHGLCLQTSLFLCMSILSSVAKKQGSRLGASMFLKGSSIGVCLVFFGVKSLSFTNEMLLKETKCLICDLTVDLISQQNIIVTVYTHTPLTKVFMTQIHTNKTKEISTSL